MISEIVKSINALLQCDEVIQKEGDVLDRTLLFNGKDRDVVQLPQGARGLPGWAT
jgi:hypothetical protein